MSANKIKGGFKSRVKFELCQKGPFSTARRRQQQHEEKFKYKM